MPTCVIAGVGPGNGRALAACFAREGYRIAALARSEASLEAVREIEGCLSLRCDVSDPESVRSAFTEIEGELGAIDVLVQNAGGGRFGDCREVEAEDLAQAWQSNVLGLFHCSRAVLPGMTQRGRGSIVVIGATASLRGGEKFAAFAQAKAAQRTLAQSMARRLGRDGIHVAHLVIDGAIDHPRMRERLPSAPDSFFLAPEAIARSVLHLVEQEPSAWTFELDIRPFGERW